MQSYVERFSKEFAAFANRNAACRDAEIRLSVWRGKWALSYEEGGQETSQEFASLLFLSACPFYGAMTDMLSQMERQMEFENCVLDIRIREGHPVHWRVDSINLERDAP